jgi:beta-N-acetylhexosaminidase
MAEQIGALVADVAGLTLTPEDKEILAHPLIGGVILFARNYESRRQLQELCQQIRRASPRPILIMVDQEGGRVQRFVAEFTKLPSMSLLGELFDQNAASGLEFAQECGWLMAAELLSAGVDLSLAPVLDVNKGLSSVIGQRAFHANHQAVVRLATAFTSGMREAGMAAVGKHFPGHGSVTLDSHVALPIDSRTLAEVAADDILPFKSMIAAGLTAVMAAHIVFPQIDQLPVGFSRYWLQDILRQQLGFKGVVFSDDLSMEGANISANYADRVLTAREAGCDIVLLCNHRPGVIQVLDAIPHVKHMLNAEQWGVLSGRYLSQQPSLEQNQRWQRVRKSILDMV